MLSGGGDRFARSTVLPPIPSLTKALRVANGLRIERATPDSSFVRVSMRTDTMLCQRSLASSVLQVPSVIESPNATTERTDSSVSTSIDLSHIMFVVVSVNGVAVSFIVWSPELSALRYEVVTAPLCWLASTPAPGMYRLTARSCCDTTRMPTGSPSRCRQAGSRQRSRRSFARGFGAAPR